jgi:catechol 2,3-dioxygenase-like lactoylglutathione lyase family enzyme
MFDHVTIRVRDPAASERFYAAVLGSIGIQQSGAAGEFGEGCAEFAEWDDYSLAPADAEHPATTGLHVGFCAPSREDVDRFWQTGVDAGYRDDGAPGPRPQYRDDYYGGFLRDPDGNSVEAVHHGAMRRAGNIDHLWIRVPDLDATAAFYESLVEFTGFRLKSRPPGRVHFDGEGSSFALVAEAPATQNLHIAFGTDSNEAVDAFHAAALAAGHRDNGAPGERPQYHAGYYAAFVLDPAATNVEVVNHNRVS